MSRKTTLGDIIIPVSFQAGNNFHILVCFHGYLWKLNWDGNNERNASLSERIFWIKWSFWVKCWNLKKKYGNINVLLKNALIFSVNLNVPNSILNRTKFVGRFLKFHLTIQKIFLLHEHSMESREKQNGNWNIGRSVTREVQYNLFCERRFYQLVSNNREIIKKCGSSDSILLDVKASYILDIPCPPWCKYNCNN